MKPDVEILLTQIQTPEPSSDLRSEVLRAVETELATAEPIVRVSSGSTYSRWERRFVWASGMALLFAVGLNFLAYGVGEARLARFRPSLPEPQYIAEMTETIRSATDPETARWYHERLVADHQAKRSRRSSDNNIYQYYQQVARQLAIFQKELYDVQTQKREKSSHVDRDRSGQSRGDTSYRQRHRRLDYRFTA